MGEPTTGTTFCLGDPRWPGCCGKPGRKTWDILNERSDDERTSG